jgi:hypothetical protein
MAKAKRKSLRATHTRKIAAAHEPKITEKSTQLDLVAAYNWYNEYYESDDAKSFALAFLKQNKKDKKLIKKTSQVKSINLRFVGWNCRILSNGNKLPADVETKMWKKLDDLVAKEEYVADVVPDATVPVDLENPETNVISIRERVENRASELIGDMEVLLDKFYTNGETFDPAQWFRNQSIKPQIAKIIRDYYTPLYSEVFDASTATAGGKNSDLAYAYRGWKKSQLKKYVELLKSILAAAETQEIVAKAIRKPRKKKEKSPADLTKKIKYQEKDETLKLTSVVPSTIVGSTQLWTFNTKNRMLSCFNAMGPSGLSIKGSTLTGFDEKTSTSKKLRKPQDVLPRVLDGGKIVLRNVLKDIRAVEKAANGRINNQTILLRVVK